MITATPMREYELRGQRRPQSAKLCAHVETKMEQRPIRYLAVAALLAVFTAAEGVPQIALATSSVDLATPSPTDARQPPKELGPNWRQTDEIDLAGDGLRLRLRDDQWALTSPAGWPTGRLCRKFASILVYDPQLGLLLVARRELKLPVVYDWSLMTEGLEDMAEVPLRSAMRDAPAMPAAPRFPLDEYAWRTKLEFDEQRHIARWGFTAKTSDVTWAAYSWLLFDGTGFTSVLLLSRPRGEAERVWSSLDSRADPPVIVQYLSPPKPLTAGDTTGLDTYGTDFLALFQLSDAVGCLLRARFGAGY